MPPAATIDPRACAVDIFGSHRLDALTDIEIHSAAKVWGVLTDIFGSHSLASTAPVDSPPDQRSLLARADSVGAVGSNYIDKVDLYGPAFFVLFLFVGFFAMEVVCVWTGIKEAQSDRKDIRIEEVCLRCKEGRTGNDYGRMNEKM